MKHHKTYAALTIILTALSLLSSLPLSGCGDSGQSGDSSNNPLESGVVSAEDKAARLAAQTQLRNAQMSMESYYAENGAYPTSAAQLKQVDPRLSPNINVVRGGSGYEINIKASDSQGTVYIVRKTGSRTEHVDENGNAW